MKSYFQKVLILLIIISNLSNSALCQFKSHIQVIINSVEYKDGLLIVKYNLLNSKDKDNVRVWIDVFNSKNDTIKAKSWEGDVKDIASGNGEKIAKWDIFKDGVDLVDSVNVKISATVENRFYLDDPLILSTLYPGWGDYKLKARKPYWIYGAIGYSCVGASLGMFYSTINNYNKYLDANTIGDKNKFHNNAKTSKVLCFTFVGVAGAVWAFDFISVLKRKKEIKRIWEKKLPIKENTETPCFKIVSALSDNIFINTRLTNLKLVAGSEKYIDLDRNFCLDAFEEGHIEFDLYNEGPANAVSFYAKISSQDKNSQIIFPDSLLIMPIKVNQSRKVHFPIRAKKAIIDGNIVFNVSVSSLYNRPVEPFTVSINTCKYDYKKEITDKDLLSSVDSNIPVLPVDSKEKFALIIGNEGYANEFTGLSKNFNVPFARNDALAFKKYAINVLGVKENNIVVLLDAKKKEMYENILILSDKVKQIKNRAELIFFYAGQGLSDTNTTAPYLMPVDIPPSRLNEAISLDSLYRKVGESKSIKSTVILDASFNNSGRIMGLRGPNARKIQFRPEVIPSNTVVFSAGWNISDVYINDAEKHGLFTYALLKTLKNTKGNLTYLQLDNSVNTEILSYTKVQNENRASTTYFSKDISDIWANWKIR
jgi:hypothetical protein